MSVSSRKNMAGVTLVELIMTIVIISIALLAVSSMFARVAGQSSDPAIQAKSIAIAQAYLDEILSKKYDHNTPVGGVPAAGNGTIALSVVLGSDAGETRATFNDVDDYDGISDSPPQLVNATFNQYPGYQVDISVSYAGGEIAGLGIPNNQLKRIQLTVSNPMGQSMIFSAYRGNF